MWPHLSTIYYTKYLYQELDQVYGLETRAGSKYNNLFDGF